MGLFSSNKSSSTSVFNTTTNTTDLSGSVGSIGVTGSTVTGKIISYYVPTNIQIGDSALASSPSNNPTVSVPNPNPSATNVANSLINQLTSSTALHSFLIYGLGALIILHFLKK